MQHHASITLAQLWEETVQSVAIGVVIVDLAVINGGKAKAFHVAKIVFRAFLSNNSMVAQDLELPRINVESAMGNLILKTN